MDLSKLASRKPYSAARKEILSLRAYSFSAYSTQALIVSFIPLYFLGRGFSEQQIGIIYSTGPFISIFANILMGIASDKFRTIRKLLMLLLFGQLVMISLLFPTGNFGAVCAVMTGFYFFQTPLNPLGDSLILLSSKHTGTPYAMIRIFGSLGFAVSAYFIGLILKHIGTEWTLSLALTTISITLFFAVFLKDYQSNAKKMQFSGFLNMIRERRVILFFLLILLVSISHRMYEGFLAVTMKHMGASDSFIGFAWLVSAASEIPILYLLGKFGHKLKELPLLMFGSLMYAVRLWMLSEIESPGWLIGVQLMNSISFGIYFTAAYRYLSYLIPDEYRASGQAAYAVVWTGMAGLVSGIFGGFLYEHFGRVVFYQTATLFALAAAAGFLANHFYNSRAER